MQPPSEPGFPRGHGCCRYLSRPLKGGFGPWGVAGPWGQSVRLLYPWWSVSQRDAPCGWRCKRMPPIGDKAIRSRFLLKRGVFLLFVSHRALCCQNAVSASCLKCIVKLANVLVKPELGEFFITRIRALCSASA